MNAARQASLSITNSRSSLRLMSIESVMSSSHLILCHPLLLLPPIPPSIRIFSNESTHCIKIHRYGYSCCLVTKSYPTLCDPVVSSLPVFSGQETGVGCHFLLQGIFPTQGLNPRLLYWQADSIPLSHQGSPMDTVTNS